MGRRNTGMAEDLFDIAALLPWWGSVGLAIVAFVILHRIAGTAIAPPAGVGGMGEFAAKTLYVTMAKYAQWIVPIPLLVGAAVSAYQRRKRARLHAEVAGSEGMATIDGMTWQEFEMLVGEAFRQRGFSVVETGTGGADGGVDLVLSNGREKYLVQCKQWKALKVGVAVVRELYGVMASRGATGGFVVTSGSFSPEAVDFAKGKHIDLIDGRNLAVMIRQAQQSRGAAPDAERVQGRAGKKEARSETTTSPECPKCGTGMVKRIAKQGANAGKPFWGCGSYPKCRGTRPID